MSCEPPNAPYPLLHGQPETAHPLFPTPPTKGKNSRKPAHPVGRAQPCRTVPVCVRHHCPAGHNRTRLGHQDFRADIIGHVTPVCGQGNKALSPFVWQSVAVCVNACGLPRFTFRQDAPNRSCRPCRSGGCRAALPVLLFRPRFDHRFLSDPVNARSTNGVRQHRGAASRQPKWRGGSRTRGVWRSCQRTDAC